MGNEQKRPGLEFKDGYSKKTVLGIAGLAVACGLTGLIAGLTAVSHGVPPAIAIPLAMSIDGTSFMALTAGLMLRKTPPSKS